MNKEHTPILVDLKCVEKCPLHPYNIIIYFCKRHDDIGCYQCMSTSHSECTTTNIDDIAEGIKGSLEYKALLEELNEVKLKAEQNEVQAGENILNSDICLSNVLQDIRNFRHDIDAHLDQMERAVSEEGRQVNQDNRLLMKELGNESKAIRENVEHILKELREPETKETKLFIKMKQGKNNGLRCKHEIDHSHTRIKKKKQSFSFKPNTKLADIFRTNNSFGTICIERSSDVETSGERDINEKVEKDIRSYNIEGDLPTDKHKEITPVATNSNVSSNRESVETSYGNENPPEDDWADSGEFENGDKVRSDLAEIKPYTGSKINAKLLSDKEDCDISGMDILSDNEIVLADYNNRSVKVIDLRENKIKEEFKLAYHPYDLAVPAENMIAVTLTNTIQIIRRSHLLRQAESISVDGECYGIAGNENKLFVSFIKPSPKVEILNHQGDVLQRIEMGTTRQRVLKRPRYIAVCPYERFIYVTDFDTESIVQLNLKGEYVKVFRDTAILNGPYGIHVDLKGHVFVCNYGNDNIYEFSADLSNYKIVLSKAEGIESPQSIYMDSKANRLFVACTDSSDCNEVLTYNHCAEKVKE